jgi:putative spermidine/putrescine transport system substrate-binding protein
MPSKSRRAILGAVSAFLALATILIVTTSASSPAVAKKAPPLPLCTKSICGNIKGTIAYYDTSGGQVWTVFKNTFVRHFTKATGASVVDDYQVGSPKFYAAQEAGRVPWSFIQHSAVSDFLTAKQKGYVIPFDKKIVPLHLLRKGTYDRYGIQSGTFGMVLTWNSDKWPVSSSHPSNMADLFNTTKFPGKRCLFNYPEYGWTLESALLADGVAPAQLYPLDVDRALKKLDTIKKDVVWWSSGATEIQDFQNGSCDLGIMWSGRVYTAVTQDHVPLALTWRQAGYASSVLSIPKGAPNPRAAQVLARFIILDKRAQVSYATQLTYPTPIGVLGVKLTQYPQKVRAYVPLGANLTAAIAENDAFYFAHLADIEKTFNNWLSG